MRAITRSLRLVLASAGAAVVVGDINSHGAEQTAKQIIADGGKAIALGADTTDKAQVDALVDRAVSEFGRIDIMCNVAGIGYAKQVVDITEADFDRVVAINVKGVLFGCQAALKHMIPQKSGSIVNVASTAVDMPVMTQALYGMTKTAVAFLSKTLGHEVGAHGIRVNATAPGATPTNFGSFRYPDGNVDEAREKAYFDMLTQGTPLGFIGEAIDQAMLILFLVSPAARWATGNVWRVNGGQSRA